jgi:hypothetical protein
MDKPQVFFIYNTRDLKAMIAVRNLLRARSISTYLDRDNLVAQPGKSRSSNSAISSIPVVACRKGGKSGTLFFTEHQVVNIRIPEP